MGPWNSILCLTYKPIGHSDFSSLQLMHSQMMVLVLCANQCVLGATHAHVFDVFDDKIFCTILTIFSHSKRKSNWKHQATLPYSEAQCFKISLHTYYYLLYEDLKCIMEINYLLFIIWKSIQMKL
jgi:hypothetical protein